MSNITLSPTSIQFPVVVNPGQAAYSPLFVIPTLTGAATVVTLAITPPDMDGVFVATLLYTTETHVPTFAFNAAPIASTSANFAGSPSATMKPEPLLSNGGGAYLIQIFFIAPAAPVPGDFQGTLVVSWPGGVAQTVTLAETTAQLTATVATSQPIKLMAGGQVSVPVKIAYASVDTTSIQVNLAQAIFPTPPPPGLTITSAGPTTTLTPAVPIATVTLSAKADTNVATGTQTAYVSVSNQEVTQLSTPVEITFDILRPPIVATPVEAGMHSVTVKDVVKGATVDVYVNNANKGSKAASATSTVVEVPLKGSLRVNDSVNAHQNLGKTLSGVGPAVFVIGSAPFYYPTQHYNNERTGWFPYEGTLDVKNVPKLKLLFKQHLDGTVYAQPIYAHHVNIPGKGVHNVVYVATQNDSVYAFDAETHKPALWHRHLIPHGEQVVSWTDVTKCNNIWPTIGITSTPVIDPASHTMWVVAKTRSAGDDPDTATYYHRLYALDISTGDDLCNPAVITASCRGAASPQDPDKKGRVKFDPRWQMNRPALLLAHGRIYIGFGSHCDYSTRTYHGWVLAYHATTLKKVGVFCTTPDSDPTPVGGDTPFDMGAVWQSGMGLAADPEGWIYFITGNGKFDANKKGKRNYGDTAVKLGKTVPLTVVDWFTPKNQDDLQRYDYDFGSGGPLILPDPDPLGGIALKQAMVACGKDGQIYLIDRQNMGRFKRGAAGADDVLNVVPLQPHKEGQPGVWGGPAYFNNNGQQFVYYAGNGGPLTAFSFSGNSLLAAHQSSLIYDGGAGHGGTTPVVSSNQQIAGTGVVWALLRSNPLVLTAFDATDLTRKLIAIPAGPWNNPNGGAFVEPTVINGKVYVPSDGELNVFGL